MNIVIVGRGNLETDTFLRKASEDQKHGEGLCSRLTSPAALVITRGSHGLGSQYGTAGKHCWDNIFSLRELRGQSVMEGKKE